MNEQANKVLADLLQKASNGIDAAVSFSQAQIPDVVHQLLIWNFTKSLLMTVIAFASVYPVVWILRRSWQRIPDGVFRSGDGYSCENGRTKYVPTLMWDKYGEISFTIMIPAPILVFWATWFFMTVLDLTWLKIWIAPKLYLLEYAASLIK